MYSHAKRTLTRLRLSRLWKFISDLHNSTCGDFELIPSDQQTLSCEVLGVTVDPDPLETCLDVACAMNGNAVTYVLNENNGCEVQRCTSEQLANPPLVAFNEPRDVYLLSSENPDFVDHGVSCNAFPPPDCRSVLVFSFANLYFRQGAIVLASSAFTTVQRASQSAVLTFESGYETSLM